MMFAAQLEAAIQAAPRHQLPDVTRLLWRAYAEGQVSEAEASRLSDVLELRKAAPRLTEGSGRPRTGSRPRTDASMERRRRWASAGRLPPSIAALFTLGEQSVLAVISFHVAKHGSCRLPLEAIGALAGVTRSTVKRALYEARRLGIVHVEERRLTGWRNLPSVITIASPEWSAWLRLRPKGEGSNLGPAARSKAKNTGLRTSEKAKSDAGSRPPMRYGQGADWNSGRNSPS